MDQELRLEQKNQQLSTILKVVSRHVDAEQLEAILEKMDASFPEMDFYNCSAFVRTFPQLQAALKFKKSQKLEAQKAISDESAPSSGTKPTA